MSSILKGVIEDAARKAERAQVVRFLEEWAAAGGQAAPTLLVAASRIRNGEHTKRRI